MTAEYVWSTIFFMTVVTYIPRVIPFLFLSNKKLPEWFNLWLKYVPTSIFGAMIFSEVFVRENGIFISFMNINFISSLVVFFVAFKTRSLFGTIATGFLVYWFLQIQNIFLFL